MHNNHFKIIVPLYNVEKWISLCIRSVKRQEYQNFECILIDDISTDNTVQIIKKEIESELKSSLGTSFFGNPGKVRKAIEDIVRDELSREMSSGGKMETEVANISKKILKNFYREISHSYSPYIDRIKL